MWFSVISIKPLVIVWDNTILSCYKLYNQWIILYGIITELNPRVFHYLAYQSILMECQLCWIDDLQSELQVELQAKRSYMNDLKSGALYKLI